MFKSSMAAIYVGSLLNKDRRESYHRDEPPLVFDKGIHSDDVHFTFIDIIPQLSNSNLSFLNSNRTNVTYHNFSDLIKRANAWLDDNRDWQIVNCETVLLFFKQDNGIWHLAAENSCFTLDMGAQSSLMALRLWIRRSSLKQHDQLENHKTNSTHQTHSTVSSKTNQTHYQNANHTMNHIQTNHQSTNYIIANHTNHQHTNHQQANSCSNQRKRSRREHTDSNNNLEVSKRSDEQQTRSPKQQNQLFSLNFRDYIPDNPEPDDHSKFEKLDQVVDKLNREIMNGELLAENVITVETLYFPVDCDWIIDNKLELTLHSFPSNYVCILRVFFIEYASSRTSDESLTGKLNRLNYAFRIQLKDFIPRTLSKGTFFKRPEFEQLSCCIRRASNWIERESKLHQSKFQNLIKQLNNVELSDFLFDFKNAQCIEVKTKVLKHKIDSKIMAHTSNSGDYIRIFRVAYMELVSLDNNEMDETSTTKKQSNSSKLKSNLISKSKSLIKSKRLNKSSSRSTDALKDTLNDSLDSLHDENNSTIHLSSIIFTPTNEQTTIQEMKRKIQTWSSIHCRDDQTESDELAKYSRKPRLLSAETVEIFTKNFSAEEIEKETENCFNFNRIGTMNNFLYFSFRIYLDYLDGSLGDANGNYFNDNHSTRNQPNADSHKDRDQANRRTQRGSKEDRCVIV